jgi:hypothetical protein
MRFLGTSSRTFVSESKSKYDKQITFNFKLINTKDREL